MLGEAKTPDLCGYFLRSIDPEALRGPDGATRQLGDEQGDVIRNITGQINRAINAADCFGSGTGEMSPIDPVGDGARGNLSSPNNHSNFNFGASRTVPTAPENRPVNKAVLYCIKHDGEEQVFNHIKAWGYINKGWCACKFIQYCKCAKNKFVRIFG